METKLLDHRSPAGSISLSPARWSSRPQDWGGCHYSTEADKQRTSSSKSFCTNNYVERKPKEDTYSDILLRSILKCFFASSKWMPLNSSHKYFKIFCVYAWSCFCSRLKIKLLLVPSVCLTVSQLKLSLNCGDGRGVCLWRYSVSFQNTLPRTCQVFKRLLGG